jgi:hypothetical protein
LSSFWLILKQQWTIKISSPLFLFLAWRPSWLKVGITGHNFERRPSKDLSTKVWFKLAQWFQRSWLKCEKLMDGRTTDDARSVVTCGSGELINRYQSANETFWRADFSNAKQNILWNLCHILSIFKPLSKSILIIFMIIYWFFTHRTRQMVYISADYISLNPTCN